jgi:hypothetical protein
MQRQFNALVFTPDMIKINCKSHQPHFPHARAVLDLSGIHLRFLLITKI